MVSSLRLFGAVALLGLAMWLGWPALGSAQQYFAPGYAARPPVTPLNFANAGRIAPYPINPNYRVAPNTTLNQFAYNTAVLGRAYQNVPPYALGYNPYPQNVNYGPSYPTINPLNSLAAAGYYNNPYAYNPYMYSGGYGGASLYNNPYGMGSSTLATNPYGAGGGATLDPSYGGGYNNSYSPYGNPYYGGYMSGIADVVSATGNYQINNQRARLMNEETKRSQLDTRRKILEEARYERMQQPTAEDLRVQDLELAYNRARRDPPATEIWSGRSLNDLLRNLVPMQKKGAKGPNIPLDEEVLKHLNLKVAGSSGNVGMLKGDGSLDWPLPLQDAKFAEDRKGLAEKMTVAVEQVKLGNRIEAGLLKDMRTKLDRMNETLDRSVAEMSPTKYIEGMRYLNQLSDALKALEDRKVTELVSNAWVAKTKNVAELVKYLGDNGLEIAPAVGGGDEAAYRALHAAMAAFDNGIASVAKAPATTPEK